VGPYEELVRNTVDAVRWPEEPVSTERLARLVALRVSVVWSDVEVALWRVLRGDPRFVEVAPGMWVRRHDGPEAGVPSTPRRPPLAGSAAAAAIPPEHHADLDAVGGGGGRATAAAT
jgi:hypothetical protein